MKPRDELNIFEYDNYRSFLKDFYEQTKSKNKNFSFRFFAKYANMASPNALKRVMDGKRSLSPEGIEKFAKALKLNKQETFFFKNLVLFNQAKTSDRRQHYAQEIFRSRSYRKIHPLNQTQYNYFAKWYFVVIREMVGLPQFKEDPVWISDRLSPQISPNEAKAALEDLVRLGILGRNSKGKLAAATPHISTSDEVTMSSVSQYHREMMKRAAESIDRVPRQERELSAVTLTMSKETAKKVKEMIQDFRKEVVRMIASQSNPENVYQINLHMFPLLDSKADGKKNE